MQQSMSLEELPRLGHATLTFELFMCGWENLATNETRLKPWIDVGL